MIKGVNKQVLEINETHNGFFEKAIFFVKPQYCGMSEGRLKEIALKEMEATGEPPKTKGIKQGILKKILPFAIGLVAGLIFGAIAGAM